MFNRIINGNAVDVIKTFPKGSINTVVTSPP